MPQNTPLAAGVALTMSTGKGGGHPSAAIWWANLIDGFAAVADCGGPQLDDCFRPALLISHQCWRGLLSLITREFFEDYHIHVLVDANVERKRLPLEERGGNVNLNSKSLVV